MNTRIRQTLVAVAFAATAAAGITGATLRGETKETGLVATCKAAEWPMIPEECLANGKAGAVRFVSPDNLKLAETGIRTASNETFADRFAVAFQ